MRAVWSDPAAGPRLGPPRPARGARQRERDHGCQERDREHRGQGERREGGELAGDPHGEPVARARGSSAPTSEPDQPGQRRQHQRRRRGRGTTHAAASRTIAARMDGRRLVGPRGRLAARQRQERDAERLDEAGQRPGRGERERGQPEREHEVELRRAIRTFCSSAWNVSHSLTKPLSGGSAAMATAPTRKHAAVHGMRFISPPSASMLRVPVACSTAPAPRKSRLLNAAWLTAW